MATPKKSRIKKVSELEQYRELNCVPHLALTTTVKNDLDHVKQELSDVKTMLNTVSANGNQGLHASLRDVYGAVKELKAEFGEFKEYLQPTIDRHMFWESGKRMLRSSGAFKIFKTKLGTFVAVSIALLVINSIISPLIGSSFTINWLVSVISKVLGIGA